MKLTKRDLALILKMNDNLPDNAELTLTEEKYFITETPKMSWLDMLQVAGSILWIVIAILFIVSLIN